MAESKNWFTLIAPINNRDEALKMVKDTSMGFFFMAALQGVASFFIGSELLYDAFIYAFCGFFLRKFNSRISASVLLVLSIFGAIVTVANKFGMNLGGGNNIFLAIIVLIGAVRAVEATFKLHGRYALDTETIGETSID